MSRWGMGISSSDEYMDAYDAFMEHYNGGKTVPQATAAVLEEYRREFAADDPILTDVYLAIAKAEWMCCEQSEEILGRVDDIILSGSDLALWRELGASDADLRQRQRNLLKFRDSLRTPRKAPKKRVPPPVNRPGTALPKGTCFWYTENKVIHFAVVLDEQPAVGGRGMPLYLVAVSRACESADKTIEAALSAEAGTAAWFDMLFPTSRMRILGTVPVGGSYNGRAGLYRDDALGILFCENCGMKTTWLGWGQHFNYSGLTLRDFLTPENIPAQFVNPLQLKQMIKQARRRQSLPDKLQGDK